MSLNRYEGLIFNYLQDNVDERRHWERKVRALSEESASPVRVLDADLWDYFRERREQVPSLRQATAGEGAEKTSFVNLAEHLLRLWGVPGAAGRRTLSREEAPFWPPDEK